MTDQLTRYHKLFWGSSYDRGLDVLLFMWSDIKKQYPDAELHICYGWDLFLKVAKNNPERMKWKDNMDMLMEQEGIFHYGRVSKEDLRKIRKQCGIWAYPTYFTEINCITALECQRDGVVPVVMDFDTEYGKTALHETVKTGILVDNSATTKEGTEQFKTALLRLMGDYRAWKRFSDKGKRLMDRYSWAKIAEKWTTQFATPIGQPLVSIITPTIRKGFWNLMASNIANQSYKNIEWIVVDDHPKDRSFELKKVCDRWHIKGTYVRGKRTDRYHYGLSSANNVGVQNSLGDLIIFLQDFVLMPTFGVESLVDIYRHHPNALIAPTDLYYFPSVKPNTDSEDWFDGKLDVVGEFSWKNVRNQNKGMRFSDNPFEFEMNYGAIPKHIIEAVGGWWEFFNDGLGFDNTEFAYRAMSMGYKLIVDDTNQAVCLDHWLALKDKQSELGEKRMYRLNDPRYYWMLKMLKEGRLPLKRDEKLDGFRLEYEMPENQSQSEASQWIQDHMLEIMNSWENKI